MLGEGGDANGDCGDDTHGRCSAGAVLFVRNMTRRQCCRYQVRRTGLARAYAGRLLREAFQPRQHVVNVAAYVSLASLAGPEKATLRRNQQEGRRKVHLASRCPPG